MFVSVSAGTFHNAQLINNIKYLFVVTPTTGKRQLYGDR